MRHGPELLVDGLVFPEGPRWHDGQLWFSDVHAHRVLAVDLSGRLRVAAEVDDRPSGLGFTPDGSLLAVSQRRRRLLQLLPRFEVAADLAHLRCDFLNDMVVDGQGRAYVGFRRDRVQGQPAAELDEGIQLVAPDGSSRTVAADLQGPNGTAVSADGRTLIVAETHGRRLTAFTIREDGSLADRRLYAETGAAVPDGIALDEEGAVWVSGSQLGEHLRILPGGRIAARVSAGEGRSAIACALGGEDRRTLFMLNLLVPAAPIPNRTRPELDAQSPLRGRIDVLRVEVPGIGWP